jgi:hypothetical protein
MLLVGLIALTIQKEKNFSDLYSGIWADIDGNFLAVTKQGVQLMKDERYAVGSEPKVNAIGSYYFKWDSSKSIRTRTETGSAQHVFSDYFHVGKGDTAQLAGEGLIELGQSNNRGVVKSLKVYFKRLKGGDYISQIYSYVCPLTSIGMDGYYKDKNFELKFTTMPSKNQPAPWSEVSGVFGIDGAAFVIKGGWRGIAGEVTLIDPTTNAEYGKVRVIWNPTPGRVTDMFNSDTYQSNRVRVIIDAKGKGYPEATTRDLLLPRT